MILSLSVLGDIEEGVAYDAAAEAVEVADGAAVGVRDAALPVDLNLYADRFETENGRELPTRREIG